jgi:uncharacterized protein (DUF1330 family)
VYAYDVTDENEYAKYSPGSIPSIMQTVAKHGGKVLANHGDWRERSRGHFVLIEFPSVEAAHAWDADPDYAPARAIRHGSTANRLELVAPQFVPPSE